MSLAVTFSLIFSPFIQIIFNFRGVPTGHTETRELIEMYCKHINIDLKNQNDLNKVL
jgi:hypothetical protein